MDGPPVSFDDVSKVEHGRSYMSNRIINRSGAPASPLAMRANAPVFSAEDRLNENRARGISEHPTYPSYPAAFNPHVPTVERTLHPIESTALSQSITASANDRLM